MSRTGWVGRLIAGARTRSAVAPGGTRTPVIVAALVVGIVVAGAASAVGSAAPAIGLASSGHWVMNKVANTAVHVDGGTRRVDAQVQLPGDVRDPLLVAEGARQGFVVARDRVVVFGRSTLTVDTTVPLNSAEVPVAVETVGGPYLVYRRSGTLVRLGTSPLSVPLGGPVDRPVWTDDGTVWLRRSDDGTLCAMRPGATEPACDASTPDGALTVTSNLPAFLSSERDAVQVIEEDLRPTPVSLNTDVPAGPLVADRDTHGRLPFVTPTGNRLVLADSSGVPAGRSGGAALPVDLGPGRFTSPVASDGVVAVLDEATNRLLTFDTSGKPLASVQLPAGAGAASIVRGRDGRIYVDDADGAATHVVGPDGGVTSVKTGEGLPNAVTAPPPTEVAPAPLPKPGPQRPNPGNGPGPLPQPNPVTTPTPLGPLAAPTTLTATLASDSSVDVRWNPVDGGPEAVRYTVRASSDGEHSATQPHIRLTGPGPGETTTVQVRAETATRTSDWSAPVSVIAVGPPGAPGNLLISSPPPGWHDAYGDQPMPVSWTAPDLNGGELDHYLVETPWGERVSTTATSVRFSYPQCYLGPAEFTVLAVTTSPSGGPPISGPAARTSAPWSNPGCNPRPEITGIEPVAISARFTVDAVSNMPSVGLAKGGPVTCVLTLNRRRSWSGPCSTVTSFTVHGLQPGTSYTAVVAASNAYGTRNSPPRTFSTTGTPSGTGSTTTSPPSQTTSPRTTTPSATTSRPTTSSPTTTTRPPTTTSTPNQDGE